MCLTTSLLSLVGLVTTFWGIGKRSEHPWGIGLGVGLMAAAMITAVTGECAWIKAPE